MQSAGGKRVLLLVVAILLVDRTLSQLCPLPNNTKIEGILAGALTSQVGDGGTVTATLQEYHFTCLTVGARDLYRSFSVAVKYNASDSPTNTTSISRLVVDCIAGGNFLVQAANGFQQNVAASALSVTTRRDCRFCAVAPESDPQTSCVGEFLYSPSLQCLYSESLYCIFPSLSSSSPPPPFYIIILPPSRIQSYNIIYIPLL